MKTYLIASETIYHINKKQEELTKGISNVVSFNMDEDGIDEVLQEASYFSMFDTKKCIIVKNSKLFLASKNADTLKIKEDSEKLLKYLECENNNTMIIFVVNGKVDTKKKIYNTLNEAGNVFLFKQMTKTEMKNELSRMVIDKKFKIEDKSLWYIINNTLGNFDLAVNELNKIFIYYNQPTSILYEDVCNITSHSLENNNFKLIDAIISKNLELSMQLLEDAYTLKVEPSVIIALIYREFKLMLSIKVYEMNKYSYQNILSELNLAEWQYNKLITNLRNYNIRELKEEIVKLSNIDYEYKSGLINKDVILINYIIDLCS